MGYSTEFSGKIMIDPPLNTAEMQYLMDFSESRRMKTLGGCYSITSEDNDDVIDYNKPPDNQPGLWCDFVPLSDTELGWNGSEKTYDAIDWIEFIIEHFLKKNAHAQRSGDRLFESFQFNHVCNGKIVAQGEDPDDRYVILVKDNKVTVRYL